MEQHPIPQQISSYEFRLVGDMTLKQFLKAAAGIVIAVLINSTKMFVLIKWPLMAVFAGGGLALAFVPYQDRPLETWIVAFIKSIYLPTIYTYRKGKKSDWVETMMVTKKDRGEEINEENEIGVVKDKTKVREFIESLPSVKREKNKMTNKPITQVIQTSSNEQVSIEEQERVRTGREEETGDWRQETTGLNLKTQKLGATGTVSFGAIPMPDIPEIPNLIVGMVTDAQGKIVEGAIVEIQDHLGNPSRVLKTNALGQFRSSTQLANGEYLIIPEKENYEFDRVEVNLSGKIIEPVRIKALN